jgi:hypothetical protein
MQAQTLESIASAAELFSDARRQLQLAVDAANDLGLLVPDSFPDALDHLQDWTASVDSEARGLLPATDPANAPQSAGRQRLALRPASPAVAT